jgi:hypothetical protein
MSQEPTIQAQESAARADMEAGLQRMLIEVKRKLKPESKNELIRIIGALLLDNYSLKMQLHEATETNSKPEAVNEVPKD